MTMIENRENFLEEITGKNDINISEIQFTGNWFIDTGILGFINLMEEVYGWNLEELKNRIKENSELIYYGYFPFAYLFYHSKIRSTFKEIGKIGKKRSDVLKKRKEKEKELSKLVGTNKDLNLDKITKKDLNKIKRLEKNILSHENKIMELDSQINELRNNLINEKLIFSTKIESRINEILSNSEDMFISVMDKVNDIILNFDLNLPKDHRNFFLYNPKKEIFLSFLYLYYLLRKDLSNIKLIRALKDQESFIEFISFCKNISVNHMVFVDTIEKMLYQKKRKAEIIDFCEKEFCLDNKNKDNLKKKWYTKIQKEYGKKGELSSYEFSPDSTANPFLYSPIEFFNVGYTMPLTLNEIESGLNLKFPVYLLLLSFANAFQFFAYRNILFYTNNLNLSYSINKGIKTKISRMGKKDSIFKITWSSIIDELIENKAKFSLESMYLIEFEGIENQKLKDVRYIGITKLAANIIIDDTIRDSLNTNIQIKSGKNSEWVWILEEFIKNKPLFPHILRHAILRINNDTNQRIIKTLLYSLSVDANVKYLAKNSKKRLFEEYSYLGLEDTVFQIKEIYKWMNLTYRDVSKLFSGDKKDKMAYRAITAIKKHNKHIFVNIILKSLIEQSKNNSETFKSVKHLNDYIFRYIVQNDNNWENYALALIVGFL